MNVRLLNVYMAEDKLMPRWWEVQNKVNPRAGRVFARRSDEGLVELFDIGTRTVRDVPTVMAGRNYRLVRRLGLSKNHEIEDLYMCNLLRRRRAGK